MRQFLIQLMQVLRLIYCHNQMHHRCEKEIHTALCFLLSTRTPLQMCLLHSLWITSKWISSPGKGSTGRLKL